MRCRCVLILLDNAMNSPAMLGDILANLPPEVALPFADTGEPGLADGQNANPYGPNLRA